MGFTICAVFGSMPDLTGRSTLLWERSSVRIWSPTRHLIIPFLHRPVASAKSICIDAGTANQRYRFYLLQDVAYQVRPVASMSLEWPVALPAGSDQSSLSPSHEDPDDKLPEDALPAPTTFTLEARCSPTTSNTTRWSGSEHVCPYSWWRSPMCDLEYWRSYWVSDFLTNPPEKGNTTTSFGLPRATTSSAFKKCMGRMSFVKTIQGLAPRFQLHGTFNQAMQMQVAQPYAFIKTYCLTMLL